jgi:hypothetical protein
MQSSIIIKQRAPPIGTYNVSSFKLIHIKPRDDLNAIIAKCYDFNEVAGAMNVKYRASLIHA